MINKQVLMIIAAISLAAVCPRQGVLTSEAFAAEAIPFIGEAGFADYQNFQSVNLHRAFAIAPGGAWAWVAESPLPEIAESQALKACRELTDQRCYIYALDDQTFTASKKWNEAWPLGFDETAIAEADIGTGRGARFPDLALTTPDGEPVVLSDLRGKPVFLHFWGSWCPPCQREFTDLQALHDSLAPERDLSFVFVQGRESIERSRRWAKQHGFSMPLFDSGYGRTKAASFRLADGSMLKDRQLAGAYPTTYVLDANGLVVFRHSGPVQNWQDYGDLLRHLAEASGND